MTDHQRDDERDDDIDETDADERRAQDELAEAFGHFKSAASILFNRAANDPAIKSATKDAGRLAKKIGDAAEPLAHQLSSEISRFTKDVIETASDVAGRGKARRPSTRPNKPSSDEPTEE